MLKRNKEKAWPRIKSLLLFPTRTSFIFTSRAHLDKTIRSTCAQLTAKTLLCNSILFFFFAFFFLSTFPFAPIRQAPPWAGASQSRTEICTTDDTCVSTFFVHHLSPKGLLGYLNVQFSYKQTADFVDFVLSFTWMVQLGPTPMGHCSDTDECLLIRGWLRSACTSSSRRHQKSRHEDGQVPTMSIGKSCVCRSLGTTKLVQTLCITTSSSAGI